MRILQITINSTIQVIVIFIYFLNYYYLARLFFFFFFFYIIIIWCWCKFQLILRISMVFFMCIKCCNIYIRHVCFSLREVRIQYNIRINKSKFLFNAEFFCLVTFWSDIFVGCLHGIHMMIIMRNIFRVWFLHHLTLNYIGYYHFSLNYFQFISEIKSFYFEW